MFLLILPLELRSLVASHLPRDAFLNLTASNKAFRDTSRPKSHPTHKEQGEMLLAANFHWSLFDAKLVLPFDSPVVLDFCRVWQTAGPRALMRWISSEKINMDPGGLYSEVPWHCEVVNAKGELCRRIRVKVWERVSTMYEVERSKFEGVTRVWKLKPEFMDRAYNSNEPRPRRPLAVDLFAEFRYCLRPALL